MATGASAVALLSFLLGLPILSVLVAGEDPYRFFTWNVTYGNIYPLGVKQQGILINGQFPGPRIEAVTNDNLVVNVFNNLNEPFLLSCDYYTFLFDIDKQMNAEPVERLDRACLPSCSAHCSVFE